LVSLEYRSVAVFSKLDGTREERVDAEGMTLAMMAVATTSLVALIVLMKVFVAVIVTVDIAAFVVGMAVDVFGTGAKPVTGSILLDIGLDKG
jgi:hypothetical protein